MDLTDAAYVEQNPTITGTSLENLYLNITGLDLNRILLQGPWASVSVSKFGLHWCWSRMLVTDSLRCKSHQHKDSTTFY